jgi:uncharacterized protein YbjT (DUF2867 family)
MTSEHADESGGVVLVTGGTGFVGSKIVSTLARTNTVRVLVRAGSTFTLPPGVERVEGDVTDARSLQGKFDDVTTLVHLVGIIEETGHTTFDRVIRQGTVNVVAEAKDAGVGRFVHMSALGAQDDSRFPYHTAKFKAEQAVKASGLDYTIFRPSVIFGEGDGFITVLANVVKRFPLTPIVGNGQARFQPVQVQDVADSFARAVDDPSSTSGKTYELGGGQAYTYEEMIELIASKLGVRRPKIHVPIQLMKMVVAASSPLPKALRPPVTSEQLKMLALDNSTAHSGTADLIGRPALALADGLDYLT